MSEFLSIKANFGGPQYVGQTIDGIKTMVFERGLIVAASYLSDTPPTPVVGEKHVVGVSPTGDWAGHANEVATVQEDLTWKFFPPNEVAFFAPYFRYFDDAAWVDAPGGTVTQNDPTAFHSDGVGEILALTAKAPSITDHMIVEDENGAKFRAAVPLGGGGGGGAGLKTHLVGGSNQGVSGYAADVQWSEARDDGGWFDPSTSNVNIYPGAGRFNIGAQLRISGVSDGKYCDFSLQRMSASDALLEWCAYQRLPAAAGGALANLSALDIDFAAGEYLLARCGAGVSSWTIDHAMSWLRITKID